jgi:tRNA-2-methylthio-N6-dimethylallyladenosine synthase
MSQHDAEALSGLLIVAGYEAAEKPETADVILFQTCCVRDHAEQKLYSRINELKEMKKSRPHLILCVGGCVAQKEKRKLTEKFAHVDVVFGTNAIHDIIELLARAEHGERPVIAVPDDGPALRADAAPPGSRNRFNAWVSVMRGCDNYCSYCIVPYVRGPQRSKQPQEVIDEVEKLVGQGVREVTLLGQNVNSYGHDLKSEVTFADLLNQLNGIHGLARIRFTTSHPKDLSEELMLAIRDLPTVCEHLHLPVQAGSSRILKLMNRGYTAEEYLDKVARMRRFVPDINLTTDVIVGFPGETEEDFEETSALLAQVEFDGAYIFKYSRREGTAAACFGPSLSRDIIKRRHHALLDLQKRISRQRLAKLAGSLQVVLPEEPDPRRSGYMLGRTRGHRTAAFPARQRLIGEETAVRISRVDGWTLIGETVNAVEEPARTY